MNDAFDIAADATELSLYVGCAYGPWGPTHGADGRNGPGR